MKAFLIKHRYDLIGVVSTFLVFLVACYLLVDPDLGWHIQAGNYIFHHWLPEHDIFTFTAPHFPWVNHEWLNDIVIYWLSSQFSFLTISAIYASILTATVVIASRTRNWFVIILSSVAMLTYVAVRAEIWSLLLFVILERMIEGRKKFHWIIPFMFILWANLHGGFLLGFVVLLFYTVIQKKVSWPIVICSILATFLNPYGPELYVEIFRTLFDSKLSYRIIEWGSFDISFLISACFVPLLAVMLIVHDEPGEERLTNKKFWFSGALLILSLKTTRYFPFFILGTLRYCEESLERLRDIILKKQPSLKNFLFWSMCGFVSIAIVGSFVFSRIFMNWHLFTPFATEESVKDCNENIFNTYVYGGNLIRTLPSKKFYIDGRMPSWKFEGVDYYENYINVETDVEFQKKEFATYNISCAIVIKNEAALFESLKAQGWIVTAEDARGALLKAPSTATTTNEGL